MFGLDVGIEGSVRTVSFSAFLGAPEGFLYLCIFPPVNSLHQQYFYKR